uniref:Uncharacterized protein n=1 Tax=Glossina morsitans morsitans TaxID=37546 RepID=A0A1B0G5Y5_GLOMM
MLYSAWSCSTASFISFISLSESLFLASANVASLCRFFSCLLLLSSWVNKFFGNTLFNSSSSSLCCCSFLMSSLRLLSTDSIRPCSFARFASLFSNC